MGGRSGMLGSYPVWYFATDCFSFERVLQSNENAFRRELTIKFDILQFASLDRTVRSTESFLLKKHSIVLATQV